MYQNQIRSTANFGFVFHAPLRGFSTSFRHPLELTALGLLRAHTQKDPYASREGNTTFKLELVQQNQQQNQESSHHVGQRGDIPGPENWMSWMIWPQRDVLCLEQRYCQWMKEKVVWANEVNHQGCKLTNKVCHCLQCLVPSQGAIRESDAWQAAQVQCLRLERGSPLHMREIVNTRRRRGSEWCNISLDF